MPWEEKLAKYHVEDREDYNGGEEDYNGEERRHIYIDCHHLLHQYLSISFLIISDLLQDLKMK